MLVSFYLLRLQPDTQYLGRRHWYALSFVLPTGVTGQHYYADFFAQYYHQLARLYFASRGYLYRRRGGVAGSLVCRSNYAAYSRYWLTDDYRGLFVVLRFREAPPYDHQRQKLVLPSWKFAFTQMLISSVNWMVMGAIIWLLLGQSVNYFFVLGVLLVSSIAGVIVHIPAGIGVLEAVFIALLAGEHTSKGTIIAALLAYRVLYYFIPLLLALICYLLLESQAKKLRAKNEAAM
ncbi:lysylphosphatidylglycerol synthase transmembrane domain-containing protein [Escherichia coli]